MLLQEATGDRTLPIYIGRPEAEAIATALQGVVTKRPMTHDLMRDVLTELGVVLDHVVITELKDQTFYAELRLRRGGSNYVVSARPSDAIALAIRAGATIYAEEALLDAEGIVIAQRDDLEEAGRGRRAGGPVPRVHRGRPARGLRQVALARRLYPGGPCGPVGHEATLM